MVLSTDREREQFAKELSKALSESLDRQVIKAWSRRLEVEERAALRLALDEASRNWLTHTTKEGGIDG